MTPPRHRWGNPNRSTNYKTERSCLHCDLVKVTRHERGEHWVEFWRCPADGDPVQIRSDRTPPCERKYEARAA